MTPRNEMGLERPTEDEALAGLAEYGAAPEWIAEAGGTPLEWQAAENGRRWPRSRRPRRNERVSG